MSIALEPGERPNADYQNLLCRLFQTGPAQLGFAADYTPHGSELQERTDEVPRSCSQVDSMTEQRQEGERGVVIADAHEAALFARKVAGSNINGITLEQLDADVRRLAQDYVSQPLNRIFLEIRALRSEVFALINGNKHPHQMRHLYLIAGRLCGLDAHVALDCGQYAAAQTQARTAWLCGDLAGHNGMRGWVRGVQSLIA